MSKHTPGPYKLDGGRGKKGDLYIWTDRNEKGKGFIGTFEKCMAVVRPIYSGEGDAAFWEEEQAANAALFIAAPYLLEACKAAMPMLILLSAKMNGPEQVNKTIEFVRDAIRKATASSESSDLPTLSETAQPESR